MVAIIVAEIYISTRAKRWPEGRAVGLSVAHLSFAQNNPHKHRRQTTACKSHAPWTLRRLTNGGLFTEWKPVQQNDLILCVS